MNSEQLSPPVTPTTRIRENDLEPEGPPADSNDDASLRDSTAARQRCEENAPVSYVEADVGSTPGDAPPSGEDDVMLVSGFGQLVRRVARLETMLLGLLNGQDQACSPSAAFAAEHGVCRTRAALTPGPPPAGRPVLDRLSQAIDPAWRQSPLPLRLRFVRDLLPADHALQYVLKEAAGLEELRGRDLETWLTGYPSLFADAVERLETQPEYASGIPEELAAVTLLEARRVFEDTIQAMGIEWILPVPGDHIGDEHEVVGEEESAVPAGRVARLQRRGFRRVGRLALSAQVIRATPERARVEGIGNLQEAFPTDLDFQSRFSPSPGAGLLTPATPDWYRTFLQRTAGCELQAIQQLTYELNVAVQAVLLCVAGTLPESDMVAAIEPLLPLLSAKHVPSLLGLPGEWGDIAAEARGDLLTWLRTMLDIVPIAPAVGEFCDLDSMLTVSVRPTSHAHEDGAVAKLERIGLRRGERVLFRAQVMCYEVGFD